jgi:hypothetical protein
VTTAGEELEGMEIRGMAPTTASGTSGFYEPRPAALLSIKCFSVRRAVRGTRLRTTLDKVNTMRFMLLMIPGGYGDAAPGTMPEAAAVAEMMVYNEALGKAGVLLALDGLHPPSMGARVTFARGKAAITDGPFSEAKEVVGGYWMLQVHSREEALEWAARCPAGEHDTIEVRQVMEFSDFPPDVQAAAGSSVQTRE